MSGSWTQFARERRAGVLLHVSSLPSPYGHGDMGHGAYRFIEFLAHAGFRLWQVLPLGPTQAHGSPYDTLSVHAGNPEFISIDWLCDRGLVTAGERDALAGGRSDRAAVLAPAALKFAARVVEDAGWREAYATFCRDNAHWLDDFALFIAVREHQAAPWFHWPAALRDRDAAALAAARAAFATRIAAVCFEQFVFASQWLELREFARARGIALFGDMPIFVAHDSADVWAGRAQFRVDASGQPEVVTGVPPDYFSAEGQRWGNPHYAWAAMAADGFAWWRARMASALRCFDLVRIDHFRGFEACWEIPADEPGARAGRWAPAPGNTLLAALRAAGADGALVAENLGIITAPVEALRRRHGLPGMLILQFGFDGDPRNPYLQHNHERLAVVYTGTHDNDTTLGWYQSLPANVRAHVDEYFGHSAEAMPWPVLRAALASVAGVAVLPLQDLLGLDSRHRMNTPGVTAGNWRWQYDAAALDDALAQRLRALLGLYGRLGPVTGA